MLLKNETDVLIDKMILCGIEIEGIDNMTNLISQNIVSISQTNPCIYRTHDGQAFTDLILHDEVVNRFKAGAICKGGKIRPFCFLEMCIPGSNNLNCFSCNDYFDQVKLIQDELYIPVALFWD